MRIPRGQILDWEAQKQIPPFLLLEAPFIVGACRWGAAERREVRNTAGIMSHLTIGGPTHH